MWCSGQVWRAKKPVGVWLDNCLEWRELVERGLALVLPEGAILLALEETQTLHSDNKHVYHSTLCLDLDDGAPVYNITNDGTEAHGLDYERVT